MKIYRITKRCQCSGMIFLDGSKCSADPIFMHEGDLVTITGDYFATSYKTGNKISVLSLYIKDWKKVNDTIKNCMEFIEEIN